MNIKTHIVKLYNDIHNTLFPRACMVCGILMTTNEECICVNCLNTLPFSNTCYKYNNYLEQLFDKKLNIISAASLLYYDKSQENHKLIYLLKYKNRYDIGRYLGKIGGANLKESGRFKNIDCIIPVPLSLKSLRKRGYNQSMAICDGIKDMIEKPIYDEILSRTENRARQSSLPFKERAKNAEGIYSIKEGEKIKGKNILIVDDIITSGSTMVSCIKTLQKISGVKIYVYSLAAIKC